MLYYSIPDLITEGYLRPISSYISDTINYRSPLWSNSIPASEPPTPNRNLYHIKQSPAHVPDHIASHRRSSPHMTRSSPGIDAAFTPGPLPSTSKAPVIIYREIHVTYMSASSRYNWPVIEGGSSSDLERRARLAPSGSTGLIEYVRCDTYALRQ